MNFVSPQQAAVSRSSANPAAGLLDQSALIDLAQRLVEAAKRAGADASDAVAVRGSIGANSNTLKYSLVADNPPLFATGAFRAALQKAGVTVDGQTRLAATPAGATEVTAIASPPLSQIIGEMDRESINIVAELLFRAAAHAANNQVGSAETGLANLREFLSKKVGLPGTVVNVADGSGLSLSSGWSCSPGIFFQIDQHLTWLGTARARLGWANGPLLFYATGGAAYGGVETTVSNANGAFVPPFAIAGRVTAQSTRVAWTAGGGIEGQLAGNWTAKGEYLYVDLGGQSASLVSDFGLGFIQNATLSTSVREHIFRLGLNYKLF